MGFILYMLPKGFTLVYLLLFNPVCKDLLLLQELQNGLRKGTYQYL